MTKIEALVDWNVMTVFTAIEQDAMPSKMQHLAHRWYSVSFTATNCRTQAQGHATMRIYISAPYALACLKRLVEDKVELCGWDLHEMRSVFVDRKTKQRVFAAERRGDGTYKVFPDPIYMNSPRPVYEKPKRQIRMEN